MSLLVNIHQLEHQNVLLEGELAAAEVGWDTHDEMIRISRPLEYQLEAQQMEKNVFIQGSLRQSLECTCVRCLKPFTFELVLSPWSCVVELEGEEKAALINDCVDLTAYVREDIFLAFPRHPLCGPQCTGPAIPPKDEKSGGTWELNSASSAWAELDKLKLD